MNPIEAAAESVYLECDSSLALAHNVLMAFFRAAFGCPQCGGSGEMPGLPGVRRGDPCPAKHVKITVLGQTIWAYPDKCVFVHEVECDEKGVDFCGNCDQTWQPRWDTILESES